MTSYNGGSIAIGSQIHTVIQAAGQAYMHRIRLELPTRGDRDNRADSNSSGEFHVFRMSNHV